jgi:hypothetical protein
VVVVSNHLFRLSPFISSTPFVNQSIMQDTHNHEPRPTTINNIHSARIVDADASHAVAHNRAILLVQLDQFPAKLASTLKPRSPVVAEPSEKRSRDVVELAPVTVESPEAQSQEGQAKRRYSSTHDFSLSFRGVGR